MVYSQEFLLRIFFDHDAPQKLLTFFMVIYPV